MKANMKRPALEGTAETLGNLEDLRVLRAGQRSARQAQAPIDRAEPGDLIRVEDAADGVGDMVILTRLAEDTESCSVSLFSSANGSSATPTS